MGMPPKVFGVAFMALISVTSSSFAQSSSGSFLKIEDVFSMKYIKADLPIDLSPDGQVVAYTLEDRSKKQKTAGPFIRSGAPAAMIGCDVWLTNARTGVSKSLTGGNGNSWGPVWSPDGQYLAFYSDRSGITHLWVWDRPTSRLHQISSAVTLSYNADRILWTSDSKKLLTRLLPEGLLPESKTDAKSHFTNRHAEGRSSEVTVRLYKAPEDNNQSKGPMSETRSLAFAPRADLALIDLASGRVERIARQVASRWTGISPDGARVAFTVVKPRKDETSYQDYTDLVVVNLADGRARTVASDIPQWYLSSVAWSPDGRQLAYSTNGVAAEGQVFIVAADGSGTKEVAKGRHPAFKHFYAPPLWSRNGKCLYAVAEGALWRLSLDEDIAVLVAKIPQKDITDLIPGEDRNRIWSPGDRESVVVVASDNSTWKTGFYRIDLGSGGVTLLIEEEKEYGGLTAALKMDVSDVAANLVFASQSAQDSEDLWITDANFGHVKQLTHINPQIDRVSKGERRILNWTAANGGRNQGLLLLPSGYRVGMQYPLIVFVYAKAMAFANAFGFWGDDFFNMQLFATRGYAVLYPDVPISKGEPMKSVADVVLPGVDKVIELGIADPNQVGVMGHSYGGYVTLSLIVQSTRFKVAVDSAGPGNLLSIYGIPLRDDGSTFGAAWAEGQQGMNGSPWHSRDQYLRNSPWFFLDRVETPLLIIQGTGDLISVTQSDEIFVGLRRLGKTVEYAKYEGEGHYPGVWSAANKLNAARRMVDWFEKHLKQAAPVSAIR
jgi:dipeptidyl aminopeptidase/acylaminoacyl peptidase